MLNELTGRTINQLWHSFLWRLQPRGIFTFTDLKPTHRDDQWRWRNYKWRVISHSTSTSSRMLRLVMWRGGGEISPTGLRMVDPRIGLLKYFSLVASANTSAHHLVLFTSLYYISQGATRVKPLLYYQTASNANGRSTLVLITSSDLATLANLANSTRKAIS